MIWLEGKIVNENAAEAKPTCEHGWSTHMYNQMSVRICYLCNDVDWEYEQEKQTKLAGEIANFLEDEIMVDKVASWTCEFEWAALAIREFYGVREQDE